MIRAALILALLAGLAAPGTANALTADCLGTDQTNFDEVYACMSSFRDGGGANKFVNTIATSACMPIRKRYRSALVASLGNLPPPSDPAEAARRMARVQEIIKDESLGPSCEILARVSKEITGKDPFWDGCLGYGSMPLQQHMGACLGTFVPGYYGSARKPESLQGCGDVFANYEAGLKAASPDQTLPAGYVRPGCEAAADYLASLKPKPAAAAQAQGRPAWEPCMDYDPGDMPTHARACLGLSETIPHQALLTLTDCRSVRAAYESGLTKAYARLPQNYVILPCSVADGIVAEISAEKTRIEEERRRAEIEKTRAEAARAANVPAPERGFFSGALITWTILGGIVVALALGGWFVLKRRARQG